MKQIFAGIYKTFSDSGGDLDVFESELYLNHIKNKLLSFTSNNIKQYENISLLVSLLSLSKKTLDIIDYGGGAGETFFKINLHLGNYDKIRYQVYDNSKIINIGQMIS